MKLKSITCALIAVLCAASLAVTAAAAQVDCDAAYCFSAADFSTEEELAGICITGLPDASAGTVMLGQRVLRPGDILTAEQVAQMTFHPLRTETDLQTMMTYLPIYKDRVESVATMSIAVIGKHDQGILVADLLIADDVKEVFAFKKHTGNARSALVQLFFAECLSFGRVQRMHIR